jgi:hypothetical protein
MLATQSVHIHDRFPSISALLDDTPWRFCPLNETDPYSVIEIQEEVECPEPDEEADLRVEIGEIVPLIFGRASVKIPA